MKTRIALAGIAGLAGFALSGGQILDTGPVTEMSPPELVLPPPVEGEIPSIAEDIGPIGEMDPNDAATSLLQIVKMCREGERTSDEIASLAERYGRFYRAVRAARDAFQQEAATATEKSALETSAQRYRDFSNLLDGLPNPDAFKCPDPAFRRYWAENTLEGATAARIAREDAELMREEFGKGTFRLDIGSAEILDLHNQVRAEVGSPPLAWDSKLAEQAAAYGPELAQHGRPVHSSRVGRETSRENLLQAMPGTPVQAMVGVWIAERQNFVPGTFPDVSRTGNWADVGHYTQMVWPATTHLGCAVHRGVPYDWLICRYSPPGNQDGKPVGFPAMPSPRHVAGSTPPMPQPRHVVGSTPPSPQLRAVVGTTPQMPQLRGTVGSSPTMPISDPPPAPAPATLDPFDRVLKRLSDARNGNVYHRSAAAECNAEAMRRWQDSLDRLARDARREAEAARAAGEFAQIDAHMAGLFAAEIQRLANDARSRECGTPLYAGAPGAPTAENKQTKAFSDAKAAIVADYYKALESGNAAEARRALARWNSLHQDIKQAIAEAAKGRSFTPQLRRLVQIEDDIRTYIISAQQQIARLGKVM